MPGTRWKPPVAWKGSSLVGKNNLEPWIMYHHPAASTDTSDLGCGDTFRVLPTTLKLHLDCQMTPPFSGPGTPLSTCWKVWNLSRKRFSGASGRCTQPVCILEMTSTILRGLLRAQVTLRRPRLRTQASEDIFILSHRVPQNCKLLAIRERENQFQQEVKYPIIFLHPAEITGRRASNELPSLIFQPILD